MSKSTQYWLEEMFNQQSGEDGDGVSVRIIDESGDPFGVQVVNDKLVTTSKPYTHEIAAGNVTDHSAFRRFGNNPDVGTSLEICAPCGTTYYWHPSAEQLNVVSDDATDTAAGDGARTVLIKGLDSDYNVQSETITMDGANVVQTAKSYLRLLQSKVRTVGDTGVNAGLITIKDSTNTYTVNCIQEGEGRSNYAIWTVPNEQVAYVVTLYGSENSSKGTIISLWIREYGYSWEKVRAVELIDNEFKLDFLLPLTFSAKTDIMVQAEGVLAGANVTAGFDGWYESV